MKHPPPWNWTAPNGWAVWYDWTEHRLQILIHIDSENVFEVFIDMILNTYPRWIVHCSFTLVFDIFGRSHPCNYFKKMTWATTSSVPEEDKKNSRQIRKKRRLFPLFLAVLKLNFCQRLGKLSSFCILIFFLSFYQYMWIIFALVHIVTS